MQNKKQALPILFTMAKRRTGKRRSGKKLRRNRKKRCASKKKGSSFKAVLNKIKKLRPSQRTQAMKLANNKFINDFTREVKKLKHARVSSKIKNRLRRQSKKLNKFISRKTSTANRRRMLTQRGGFLPLLLAALPALGSIIGGVISRA